MVSGSNYARTEPTSSLQLSTIQWWQAGRARPGRHCQWGPTGSQSGHHRPRTGTVSLSHCLSRNVNIIPSHLSHLTSHLPPANTQQSRGASGEKDVVRSKATPSTELGRDVGDHFSLAGLSWAELGCGLGWTGLYWAGVLSVVRWEQSSHWIRSGPALTQSSLSYFV